MEYEMVLKILKTCKRHYCSLFCKKIIVVEKEFYLSVIQELPVNQIKSNFKQDNKKIFDEQIVTI